MSLFFFGLSESYHVLTMFSFFFCDADFLIKIDLIINCVILFANQQGKLCYISSASYGE